MKMTKVALALEQNNSLDVKYLNENRRNGSTSILKDTKYELGISEKLGSFFRVEHGVSRCLISATCDS